MIAFGNTLVLLERREVVQEGRLLRLGGRAFDILAVLIEANGAIISKDELIEKVWGCTVVEDNNLQVHISGLRKVLGDDAQLIQTVPRRGYRLIPPSMQGGQEAMTEETASPVFVRKAQATRNDPGSEHLEPEGAAEPIVYIVDDEASVRSSLSRLLSAAGVENKTFESAQAFAVVTHGERPACLLLDVHLATTSGFELQEELRRCGSPMPIIFMSGASTVPMSVKAMKAGAIEFLVKPFSDLELLSAVRNSLSTASQAWQQWMQVCDAGARYASLTPREREVLTLLVKGYANKKIAALIGTSEITAKVHKKHIMTKMQADNPLELYRLHALLMEQSGGPGA
ncbi:response regulator [Pseudomonas sp. S1_E04]